MSLTDSLVSYWAMDEASGDALDAHGTNDLTDHNTVGSAAGKVNNARDFESGNSEYFAHTSNSDLQTGDIDFTLSFWVNAESLSGFPVIGKKGNENSPTVNDEWVLFYNGGSSRFVFGVTSGTSQGSVSADNFGAASTATWYFIVVWHDSVNNEIGISVNGTVNTQSHSIGANAGTSDFEIGSSVSQGLYWDGLIDEVGFWKRTLTSQERSDLYNGGDGLAYEDFGGGTDTPLDAQPLTLTLTFSAATFGVGLAASPLTLTLAIADADLAASGNVVLNAQPLALTLTLFPARLVDSGRGVGDTVAAEVTLTPQIGATVRLQAAVGGTVSLIPQIGAGAE